MRDENCCVFKLKHFHNNFQKMLIRANSEHANELGLIKKNIIIFEKMDLGLPDCTIKKKNIKFLENLN